MSFLPVNIFLLEIFLHVPVIILWIVLPVKKTSSPSLRKFDVVFTCEYILTGHFPTCTYILDMFTCEDDIIPILEELASFSIA